MGFELFRWLIGGAVPRDLTPSDEEFLWVMYEFLKEVLTTFVLSATIVIVPLVLVGWAATMVLNLVD